MIELPEAVNFARQFNETLSGKEIAACQRGNSPHKFAFYTAAPEEYAAILPGKRLAEAYAEANGIFVRAEPDYTLIFGHGGERILFHRDASTLPQKHQFLLQFTDDTYLTVSVQMWGSAQLKRTAELEPGKNFYGFPFVSPLSAEFTEDYFQGLFDLLPAGSKDSIKFFVISKPGVTGVGNGYLHDILFKSGIHPRRRALETSREERTRLYGIIRQTMIDAVAAGGRDNELDLFGKPGRYPRILDSQSAGKPCPRCGTLIEKIQFMGGASYFCPGCQN
jgi:formamidopyrimidine-DNA glycosylase